LRVLAADARTSLYSEPRMTPMSPIELLSMKPKPMASPLETFVACAHQMLDPATPEQVRRAMEPRLLAQLPALRASGVFELFELRSGPARMADG
jgi:hypothetical protein